MSEIPEKEQPLFIADNAERMAARINPEEKQRQEELRTKTISECGFKPGDNVVLAIESTGPDQPEPIHMVVGKIRFEDYMPVGDQVFLDCFFNCHEGRVRYISLPPAAVKKVEAED